jgi:hypothetical protein
MSQPSSQGDEMKISSGVSQSRRGDELIKIIQYARCEDLASQTPLPHHKFRTQNAMGVLMSLITAISQGFPPKSKFTVDDIPDMSDRVVIVTGANTGVGFEIAKVSLPYIPLSESTRQSKALIGSSVPQCESVHCCEKPSQG